MFNLSLLLNTVKPETVPVFCLALPSWSKIDTQQKKEQTYPEAI